MTRSRVRGGFGSLMLLFAALLAAGCGKESPPVGAKALLNSGQAVEEPAALASSTAAKGAEAAPEPVEQPPSAPRRGGISNLFLAPEIPEEFLAPKEEPKPEGTPENRIERPRIRLLGFSDVDGFKALVELKGEVLAVSPGDTIGGARVVSVEPPNVTFEFASARWGTKLFDQPWHNEQTGASSGASRAFAAQSRSISKPAKNLTSAARALVGAAAPGPFLPGYAASPTNPLIPGTSTGAGPPAAIPETSEGAGVGAPTTGSYSGIGSGANPAIGSGPPSGIPGIGGAPVMPGGGKPGGGTLPGGGGSAPPGVDD